jgi:hypothetical protein
MFNARTRSINGSLSTGLECRDRVEPGPSSHKVLSRPGQRNRLGGSPAGESFGAISLDHGLLPFCLRQTDSNLRENFIGVLDTLSC